jgi:phospholipase C
MAAECEPKQQRMASNQLAAIQHIVVLMLENRSFDHMLGLLYTDPGQRLTKSGQPFEGLTGTETNPDASGAPVKVFAITPSTPNAYFMPGADPGEGYSATNSQLFGSTTAPTPPVATNQGFVTDYNYTLGWEGQENWSILSGTTANSIMGIFTPADVAGAFRPGARLCGVRLLVRLGADRDVAEPRFCQRRHLAGSH